MTEIGELEDAIERLEHRNERLLAELRHALTQINRALDVLDSTATALDVVFVARAPDAIVGGEQCPPDLVFVECEVEGESVRVGEWREQDGYHVLRLRVAPDEVKT